MKKQSIVSQSILFSVIASALFTAGVVASASDIQVGESMGIVGDADGFLQIPQGSQFVAKAKFEVPPRTDKIFFQGGKTFFDSSAVADQPFCVFSIASSGKDRVMAPGTAFTVGSEGGTSYSYDYTSRRYYVYVRLQDNGANYFQCFSKTTDTNYAPSIAETKAIFGNFFGLTIAGESPWTQNILSISNLGIIGDNDPFYNLPTGSTLTTQVPINVQPRSNTVFFQNAKIVQHDSQLQATPFCALTVSTSGLDRVLPAQTILHISDSGRVNSTSSYGSRGYVQLDVSESGFDSIVCYSAAGVTDYKPSISDVKESLKTIMNVQIAGESPWSN